MLYIANHKSNIDSLVLLKAILSQETIPKLTFVAKEELKNTKIGKIADLLDVIYIDRKNIRQIPNVLDEMVKTLQNKKTSVCLFPEATRVHGDNFEEFNATLLDCVYQTNMSIQPTVIYNSDGMMEKHTSKPVDKTIDVCFMPVINSDKFINVNRNIFMKNLQSQMFNQYQKLKDNHGKN
ncbi:1-acyl-sn-glycerol-3-phosphate acyltransferase [bacterium]|nr:1-acyl-sn-glycerol-3-phosphate acyltransferase [bacterium]MBR2652141.1 1-acyl-sn-glycerol-3-phosphate acyltransferase [bacterium]